MPVKEFEYEYNPVKELKNGQEASRVIWTTKALETAVDALGKGLPLKANPFCGTNTKLLRPDLVYKRTKEEVDDIMECMKDIVYFGNKCTLMTPEGLKKVTMRDYQQDYLHHIENNRFSIYLSCRQSGKTLHFLTEILIKTKDKNISEKLKKYLINDDIYKVPLFELYNCFCKHTLIWKAKYKLYKIIYKYNKENNKKYDKIILNLISILDNIDYVLIRKKHLIDNYKTIEEIDISDYDILVETDTGYKKLSHINCSKPFEIYKIILENGYEVECADKHMLFDKNFNIVYAEDLQIGDYIQTDVGLKMVISKSINSTKVSMFDTTVDDENHRFYSNGILSHNSTTTGIFALKKALFTPDTNVLILSKSAAAGRDLLKKIKDMYLYLPYHLKCGTMKWNQSSISFDNNSTISTEAFSSTAGLGQTINVLILDEFAWCPPNEVELFYNNIIPTVTTISDSNVCIMSTQNGFNLFYKIWKNAIEKKSIYAPFKTDWYQVPQYNVETKTWERRTEKWHEMMVGILGSEEAFQYQYGTQFSASDKCLISREKLAKIRDNTILFEKYDLPYTENFYIIPNYDISNFKRKYYVVLDDLSEGGDADYTVFNIFEVAVNDAGKPVFTQCAFWRSNKVDIEKSSLEFWLIVNQFFTKNNLLISIEWNTYGALFYNYIMKYNETMLSKDPYRWRFNYGDYVDTDMICKYKKGNLEDNIAISGNAFKNSKYIPGIRWNSENKKSACALTKIMIENDEIVIKDLINVGELENFEDKNDTGSYKASYGNDDMMMTIVQIPMLVQTTKFKNYIEDIEMVESNQNAFLNNPFGDSYEIFSTNIYNSF